MEEELTEEMIDKALATILHGVHGAMKEMSDLLWDLHHGNIQPGDSRVAITYNRHASFMVQLKNLADKLEKR